MSQRLLEVRGGAVDDRAQPHMGEPGNGTSAKTSRVRTVSPETRPAPAQVPVRTRRPVRRRRSCPAPRSRPPRRRHAPRGTARTGDLLVVRRHLRDGFLPPRPVAAGSPSGTSMSRTSSTRRSNATVALGLGFARRSANRGQKVTAGIPAATHASWNTRRCRWGPRSGSPPGRSTSPNRASRPPRHRRGRCAGVGQQRPRMTTVSTSSFGDGQQPAQNVRHRMFGRRRISTMSRSLPGGGAWIRIDGHTSRG